MPSRSIPWPGQTPTRQIAAAERYHEDMAMLRSIQENLQLIYQAIHTVVTPRCFLPLYPKQGTMIKRLNASEGFMVIVTRAESVLRDLSALVTNRCCASIEVDRGS